MTHRLNIIHALEQAIAVLKTASESGESVILQSPPDAIYYAGSLYYLNLFKQAQAAYPQAKASFIFDCGDAGAEVIATIQDGHKTIKSSAKPAIWAKLKAIAAEHGVNLIEISE